MGCSNCHQRYDLFRQYGIHLGGKRSASGEIGEIGLRKAIGAKKKDITLQFLAESVLLTFTGGAIGVVLGWLAAVIVSYFSGIATSVSLSSVILAFCVSAGIGIIFGYYPARRAASLSPIEALRYE